MKKEIKKEENYSNTDSKEAMDMLKILEKSYPDAKCSLDFTSPIELVVALILAAQCTDERVNQTIPVLFKKYPDVYALSQAELLDVETIIKACGFYHNKALSIIGTAKIIVETFDGKVPDTMEDLCTLKGIGRKSSNIILQECYNKVVGIAVDTHVTRITKKMGFSNGNSPELIEQELLSKIEKPYWNKINHILVYHGRAICIARRPQCANCPIVDLCPKNE